MPLHQATVYDFIKNYGMTSSLVHAAFNSLVAKGFAESAYSSGVRYAKLTEKGCLYDWYAVEKDEKEKKRIEKAARREERKRLERKQAIKNYQSVENEINFGGKS